MTAPVRIAHGGASPEGENSTYLLPESGTVVDPGPPGEAAWTTLRAGLTDAGTGVEAVERVVVTHWHADHAGLAPRLAAAAGAPIHMHEADAPLVGEYAAERERRVERDAAGLRSWGVPDRVVEAVRAADTPSPMPEACPVRAHGDGDRVAGLELLHTPGHTAGHLAVAAGERLFVGDAVLPTYTPNVGGSDTRLEGALSTYLGALDRLEERAAAGEGVSAHPGHGSDLDLPGRIRAIRRHHRERVGEIARVLPNAGAEPVTPWAVARELFGEMAGVHAKMGAGEAAAHLQYMEGSGVAECVGREPRRYRRGAADPPDLPV